MLFFGRSGGLLYTTIGVVMIRDHSHRDSGARRPRVLAKTCICRYEASEHAGARQVVAMPCIQPDFAVDET